MNTSVEMAKTPIKFDGDYGRLIARVYGIEALFKQVKKVLGIKGEVEMRPSASHNDFDIYVSIDELFSVSNRNRNVDWGKTKQMALDDLHDLRAANMPLLMKVAERVTSDAASIMINHGIVTVHELYEANPQLVRLMAEEKMLQMPKPQRRERPELRMISFER